MTRKRIFGQWRFWGLALAAGATALAGGCRNAADPVPEQKPVIAAPGQETVMKADGHEMTLDDYRDCIDLHKLRGHMFSKRALANPRFQRDEAQRCFALVWLRDYADEKKLAPHDGLRDLTVREACEKLDAETEAAVAQKIGVTPQRLEKLIRLAMIPRMVERSLLESMPENELRKLYDADARRFSIKLIDFPNRPTDAEVGDFLENRERDIIRFLRENPRLMKQPPRARFIRMAYPKTGGEEDAASYKRADELRKTAIRQGAEAATDACKNDVKYCRLLNDAANPFVQERNESNVWAFRSPVGSVSDVLTLPASDEVWILTEIDPPQPYDLTQDSIRKTLAEKTMIATVPAPHVIDAIKPLIMAPVPDLKAIAEQNGGRYRTFDDVSYGYILQHKLIESDEVLKVLSEMKPNEARLFSNPIVDNERIYVFYVSNMTIPSDADFAENKAKWIDIAADNPDAVNANKWLAEKAPSLTTLNIKPVEFEYGILQNDGSIR